MWVVSWWSRGIEIGCFDAVFEDVVSWWSRGVLWQYIKMRVSERIKYAELEVVLRRKNGRRKRGGK